MLLPATIGGAVWAGLGLTLGWLMGAAVVTGIMSFCGNAISLPRFLYGPSLAVIGAGVGLTITPDVAMEIVKWFPLMAVLGFAGVILAAIMTPLVARKGNMEASTAFFSLMPGGVIEMANIGEHHGADRTTIATLHAIRVAIVVGILPLVLFFLFPATGELTEVPGLDLLSLFILVAIAIVGGWLGQRLKLPAAWLLGSLLTVAVATAFGLFSGQITAPLMAIAQLIVGMSLGAKFDKARLRRLPQAIAVGSSGLLTLVLLMAVLGVGLSKLLPIDEPTMVLALSIGGMAEMVLTARALELNMAIVAAFQAIRAILVNSCAGLIWHRYSTYLNNR